jgi:hypothetical protein
MMYQVISFNFHFLNRFPKEKRQLMGLELVFDMIDKYIFHINAGDR